MASGNPLLVGMALTVFAGVVFAGGDALGKHLTSLLPIVQVIWGRYVFQTLILSAYLAATTGTRFLRTRHPFLQIVRGLISLCTMTLMFQALSRVPLADAVAVIFFSPILVSILSVVILKEKIPVDRILAVGAGFAGLLLILRPGSDDLDPALLFALAASFTNALYLLLTRHLSGKEEAASTQFNTTAVGAVILSFVVLPSWESPGAATFALLVVSGLIGTFGHFALVRAFSHAPASLLSPFLYSQVLAASVISVVFFGDPLHPLMLLGTAILIASGIYIWWRENADSRRRIHSG